VLTGDIDTEVIERLRSQVCIIFETSSSARQQLPDFMRFDLVLHYYTKPARFHIVKNRFGPVFADCPYLCTLRRLYPSLMPHPFDTVYWLHIDDADLALLRLFW